MIFIILGTQKFQLNRLLQEMDVLIDEGKVKEEVFAQVGYSEYKPKNYNFVNFLDSDEFKKTIDKSRLIITHSGVGSIITALESNKAVIVYPRYAKFKEHVDDHQLEIANAFEKKRFVLCCKAEDDLFDLISKSDNRQLEKYQSSQGEIIGLIQNFLEKR